MHGYWRSEMAFHTDFAVESVLDICPYKGLFGLANLSGCDLLKMQGATNPPANSTNSISVRILMT